jgi:hypothetical protein
MSKELTEKLTVLSEEERATFRIIEKLPEEKMKKLNEEILDRANDRYWCQSNGLDYIHPDLLRISICTYRELKKQDKL